MVISDSLVAKHDAQAHGQMSGRLVQGVAHFALAHGISLEALTKATSLSLDDMVRPPRRMPDLWIGQIWKLLDEHRPGEALSLKMAHIALPLFLGPLGQAIEYARNTKDGLDMLERYQRIMSDRVIVITEHTDIDSTFAISHPSDDIDGGYGVEVAVALAARVIRQAIGHEAALTRVRFKGRAHGPQHLYDDYFGLNVEFESDANALTLPAEVMRIPFKSHSSVLQRSFEQRLDKTSRELLKPRHSVLEAEVIRALQNNALRADYSTQALADALGCSVRTLQRRLGKLGLQLNRLITDVRMSHATRLLTQSKQTVEDVAFAVGYADLRSFTRAFKRETGLTPTESRARTRS